MLTSLLPGLRELRAPLSAGVLWLLAIWFLAEPSVPDADEARGVAASAYRLAEPLSVFGMGAVIAFAAYLVGSLSVFVFSGRLRRLIPVATRTGRFGLAGLSPGGQEALLQVARDGRRRLDETLSLSGFGVPDVLTTVDNRQSPPRGPSPARRLLGGRRRAALPDLQDITLNSRTLVELPEQQQEATLADLVVRDLEVIADAQLLGQEDDVFSAVDRDRTELEFRLAVVPALVALAGALAVRQSSPVAAVVAVLLGVAAAVGLMLDAARQQRTANDLLLNLLEHDRLRAPSLSRLEARAKEVADQSPAAVPRQAGDTSMAVQALLDRVENLFGSGAASVGEALDAVLAARKSFDRLEAQLRQFGPPDDPMARLDRSVLDDLETVLGALIAQDPQTWSCLPGFSEVFPDGTPSERLTPETRAELLDRARKAFPVLREEMRRQVLAITARQAAERASSPLP